MSPFYIRSLDGIRAVAVMIVFWSHLEVWHIFPGLFGVNVFFFLSGFLITTLMIREQAARGRVSIKEFYFRRALRILPPMYIVLAIGVMLTAAGLLPGMIDVHGIIMQSLHLSNYYLLDPNHHFVAGLGVYWSLAIEEHFYVAFPFVFVLCYPRMGPKRLAALLLSVAIAVMIWRMIIVLSHPGASTIPHPSAL